MKLRIVRKATNNGLRTSVQRKTIFGVWVDAAAYACRLYRKYHAINKDAQLLGNMIQEPDWDDWSIFTYWKNNFNPDTAIEIICVLHNTKKGLKKKTLEVVREMDTSLEETFIAKI